MDPKRLCWFTEKLEKEFSHIKKVKQNNDFDVHYTIWLSNFSVTHGRKTNITILFAMYSWIFTMYSILISLFIKTYFIYIMTMLINMSYNVYKEQIILNKPIIILQTYCKIYKPKHFTQLVDLNIIFLYQKI